MSRLDDVLRIIENCGGAGITAAELGERAGLDRANSSRYLNQLVKSGHLVKLSGRPVRYQLFRAGAASGDAAPGIGANASAKTRENITARAEHGAASVTVAPDGTSPQTTHDTLGSIIGATNSLRVAVQQAKARYSTRRAVCTRC